MWYLDTVLWCEEIGWEEPAVEAGVVHCSLHQLIVRTWETLQQQIKAMVLFYNNLNIIYVILIIYIQIYWWKTFAWSLSISIVHLCIIIWILNRQIYGIKHQTGGRWAYDYIHLFVCALNFDCIIYLSVLFPGLQTSIFSAWQQIP